MPEVKILSITRIGAADRERIEAVDPAVRFTDAGGWFDGEYRETWPEYTVSRYVPRNSTGQGTRAEHLAREHAFLGRRVLAMALSDSETLSRIPGASLINPSTPART